MVMEWVCGDYGGDDVFGGNDVSSVYVVGGGGTGGNGGEDVGGCGIGKDNVDVDVSGEGLVERTGRRDGGGTGEMVEGLVEMMVNDGGGLVEMMVNDGGGLVEMMLVRWWRCLWW
jgi:hypothetical protein